MRPNNLASFGSIQGAFDACFGQMGHLHFGTGQALSVVQEALPTSDARRRWRWPTCPHATASPCSPEFNPAKITCQKYLLDSQKKCSFWFPFEQELAHETLKASRRFQRRPQRIVSTIYCWGHQIRALWYPSKRRHKGATRVRKRGHIFHKPRNTARLLLKASEFVLGLKLRMARE